MIGIPAEELLGITITDLCSPDDAALLEKQIARRRVEGHAQYEFYLPQRSGGKLPVLRMLCAKPMSNSSSAIAKSKRTYCWRRACSKVWRRADWPGARCWWKRSISRYAPSAEILVWLRRAERTLA